MFLLKNVLKQGDALSPLLFNFALAYNMRSIQVNQDGLKLNGTHQILVYADDVNILGRRINTAEKTQESLKIANKDIDQEVNAEKTKYTVVSRDQNAGRSHNMKTDSSFFGGGRFTIFDNNLNESKFYSGRNYGHIEIRECLLSFGAESFFVHFAFQKYID
jgi:hypothetical protein